jgi:hypothetical protein
VLVVVEVVLQMEAHTLVALLEQVVQVVVVMVQKVLVLLQVEL